MMKNNRYRYMVACRTRDGKNIVYYGFDTRYRACFGVPDESAFLITFYDTIEEAEDATDVTFDNYNQERYIIKYSIDAGYLFGEMISDMQGLYRKMKSI